MALKPKRILLWTGIIIMVAVLSFYGYVKYQQQESYQTEIHKNASALVRIDVYAMYQSMLPEYLRRKKRQRRHMFEGIIVPANIFLFTVKDKESSTLFTSFQLDDADAFGASLKRQEQFKAVKALANGAILSESIDKRWTIAYNNDKVVIAFSANKENVQDVLLELLQGKNTIDVAHSAFKDIAKQQGHITYLSTQDKGSLQFHNGNIELVASLSGTDFQTDNNITHLQPNNDDALQMWLYADVQPWLASKEFTIDTIRVSGDSLLACQFKGIELTLGKSVTQIDSVVTYDYNDDFEKVAQVSIKETKVPGLSVQVHADTNKLLSYLQRKNIVNADSGTFNKHVFPLYQLHTSQGDGFLQWSTIKGQVPIKTKQTTNEFFGLHINFQLLLQQEELALFKKYFAPFETLKANAKKVDKRSVSVEAMLQFKNKDKQALWQLLEMM